MNETLRSINGLSDLAHDDETEHARAARWRSAILGLSESLQQAAVSRPELSSVLMEAMHHALEQLLVFGEEGELLSLEEWLQDETAVPPRDDEA